MPCYMYLTEINKLMRYILFIMLFACTVMLSHYINRATNDITCLICPPGHGEDKMKTLKIVCVMLLLHVSLLGKALRVTFQVC